jgi:sugar lactone lactonase YvrE
LNCVDHNAVGVIGKRSLRARLVIGPAADPSTVDNEDVRSTRRGVVVSALRTILTGIVFGESPRWHDGRLWFADWAKQEVIAVTDDGQREVVVPPAAAGFSPVCFDWLPDGRLIMVSGPRRALLTRGPSGEIEPYADLSAAFGPEQWNEVVCDGRGNAYVNNIGFAFPGGEFAPGVVAVVTPSGAARVVAEGFGFPNGMAVTADNSTLIVAESYGHQLTAFDIAPDGSLSGRRVWAYLGDAAAPDGICLDAAGAVWYADVPNKHCVRVREGGEILETVSSDLGCFSCALGGTTLYIVAADWSNPAGMFSGPPTGKILAAEVGVPGLD